MEIKNIIKSLQNNEALITHRPVLPLCASCRKIFKSIEESRQFLTGALPKINQLPESKKEFKIIFLSNQDKPTSWNSVRELWTDSEYQGGTFLCRFCVPNKTHPKWRKFYLFDNRFFYLDKKWEQAAEKYIQWEKNNSLALHNVP